MHHTRSRLLLAVALIGALALAACGDDSAPNTSGGGEADAGDTSDVGTDTATNNATNNANPDVGVDGDTSADVEDDVEPVDVCADVDPATLEHPEEDTLYTFAGGCFALRLDGEEGARWLAADATADGYGFSAEAQGDAARFSMKASDLGTYLLYDQDRGYVVAEDGPLLRQETLESDVYRFEDGYISGAEWELEFSECISERHQLRSRRSGQLLGPRGLASRAGFAAHVALEPVEGCTDHPEMALNAQGEVSRTTHEDGELFGFVDTHSHILSNFGFGGGGVFHGAPFHRLGVETAMGTCEPFHGPDGRADFLGWGESGANGAEAEDLINLLSTGLLPDPVHGTDGWPTFSDWPSDSNATHQTQYYRWLERAWMSGLRLVVQHAVSNEAICGISGETGFQPIRWECRDMYNIDRQLIEIRRMEDYIDAQHGGPGKGWFKVVESPQEAREVIAAGNLAVVLGMEVPNLFDCYLTRRPDGPVCDAAHIEAQLDHYYEQGIRVLFPNHKFDNAFTPGDGSKGIMEVANFLQTGHWSNFVQDCPEVDSVFDKGSVQFGGFNQPRDAYVSEAPNELIELSEDVLLDLLPYADRLIEGGVLEGTWCQKAGLTEAGVTLIEGIMARGIVLEIDHLPRRSYLDVFEIIREADYPAMGTHGNTNSGQLFEIGGMAKTGIRRCATEEDGSLTERIRNRAQARTDAGLHPSEGFGFDLNGLAGHPDPRFDGRCNTPQENPVEYPFTSFGGDVTFEEPIIGDRVIDFNTEGMLHIGLVAELIEDARRTGSSDEDLDILFRSAEGYIQTWELAIARGETIGGKRK